MNNMTPVTGRCLAVIPARAGSRQLPGKNLKLVGRMSLVERAIDVAIHSDGVNLVVVSSDDPDVLALAEARKVVGLPRPPALAGDSVSTLQVAGHVASLFPDADPFVLLQPTSPLRTTADVEACLEAYDGVNPVVTVTPLDHPVEWTLRLQGVNLSPVFGWDAFTQRQSHGIAVIPNGAVYVLPRSLVTGGGDIYQPSTVAVLMPPERSIDIDSRFDLEVARALVGLADDSRPS